MLEVQCHCGNVRLRFERLPGAVRDCDCPFCNRLGALWADFAPGKVQVETTSSPTATYRWGDGSYEMHHCTGCGCTTHYSATVRSEEAEFGVNLRMLDRRQLEGIPINRKRG